MQAPTNISIVRAVATRCIALAGTFIAIMWFHSSLKYVAEAFAPFMARPISATSWMVVCAIAFFFAALVVVFLIHRLPWRPGILWVAAVLLLYCWPALSKHPDAAYLGDFPVLTPNKSTIDPGGENPGVRYTQNNHGFRGADWQLEKAPGVVRGVVIGDSFVYGAAVNDDETLPFQLEACLRKTRPEVEILNLGIPGHNILSHARLFELAHNYLNPDFVILFLYFNDFAHWDTGVARERLLRHPLARLPPFLLGERTWEYYEVWWYLSEDAASGHQAFLSAVSRIDAIQDQAGARPLWVFAFGDPGAIHYEELLRVPQARTIPSIHLEPEYFFNHGQGHATAAGNALYAEHICRSIKDDLPSAAARDERVPTRARPQ